MHKNIRRPAMAIAMALFASAVSASEDVFNFFEEEALGTRKVYIATKKDIPLRETPGIVSVITRDEIQNSGARDLKDILTLFVPGFSFGNDVEGVVSAHFRGIWAEEGKILVLVDGLETNERTFGTSQFGGRYAADQIEKIEIIRGPGSVIYGGFAELAVINIITMQASQNHARVTVNNSQMNKSFSHRGLTAGFGKTAGDFSSSLTAAVQYGARSDRDMTDFAGSRQSLQGNSDLELYNANVALGYKGLGFRAFLDQYDVYHIDNSGAHYTGRPIVDYFGTRIYELKYDYALLPNFKITPRLELKQDRPWTTEQNDLLYTNNKRAERRTASLTGVWDVTDRINVLSGAEFYSSQLFRAENAGPYEESFRNGTNEIGYDNIAGFAQAMVLSDIVNLTVGSRYDTSKEFGSAFVPRVALTKVWNPLHFKAMAGQSFRTPVGILPNRTLPGAGNLTPEKATHYEVELGYKMTDNMLWILSGYDVSIKDPIIYGTSPSGVGFYSNFGKIGTRGVESEYRLRTGLLDFTANYSFYYVTTNNVGIYAASGQADYLIGSPAHKANFMAGIKVSPKITINPSVTYLSQRYAPVLRGAGPGVLPQVAICNLNVRLKNVVWNGLNLSLGVQDIFDEGLDTPPGYDNGRGVTPGLSRAFVTKLTYNFKL